MSISKLIDIILITPIIKELSISFLCGEFEISQSKITKVI